MAVWDIGAAPSVIDYLTGTVFAFPDRVDVDLAPRAPSGGSESLNAGADYGCLPGVVGA